MKGDQKKLRKEARVVLRGLRDDRPLIEASDTEAAAKEWKYFEKSVMNIIEKSEGRNTYCREHSEEYVRMVVSGKAIPFKKSILDSDIISRKEQIVFRKLWRYIEERILPLAPEGIDSIVVERTAFDLLRGTRRKILGASQKVVEDVYQWGPMLGFKSSKEMLRAEFGGLCAYCGKKSDDLIEVEHIMARKDFFFDSYLNILPSCPTCNREKSSRRLGAAAFSVSEKAYEAYCRYYAEIEKKRPPHALHTEKKGILNLMRNPERAWDADRYMSLIANSLASITRTQRGPRPLARYLYSRLRTRQKQPPNISFRNGRHTALYRNVAYPDFDKIQDKEQRSTVNHSLDAMILASSLPSITALEGRGVNRHRMGAWLRSVRSRAPQIGRLGIPVSPRYDWFVNGFEDVDPSGYVRVDMASMNWNEKDSATHKQDPYGWSKREKKPAKRTGAQELFERIVKTKTEDGIRREVQRICHPGLRSAMERGLDEEPSGLAVANAMKDWLRGSVANSIRNSTFSSHPGDMRRKADLENFVIDPEAPIPIVIGVRRLGEGVGGKVDLERKDPVADNITHRYMTDPANRSVILAYPGLPSGSCDGSKPVVAYVRQNFALKTKVKVFRPKPELLDRGIALNESKISMKEWQRVLEAYLIECGFHSYVTLTRGCVVRYADGAERFVRNFSEEKFNKFPLKNVVGVRRNPFVSSVTILKPLLSNSSHAKK